MSLRPFMQVDVFTDRPYLGNPVAVVLDAGGLDTAGMQAIARWTNLSETTFVLPPTESGADYRLRIFTPGAELPFAGHPTLGSAWALVSSGRVAPRDGKLVQQCAAGLVSVGVERAAGPAASGPLDPARDRLWLRLPAARCRAMPEPARRALAKILGVEPAGEPLAIDLGPVWLTARLGSAEQVLSLRPDQDAIAALSRELGLTGITVFGPHADGEAAFEVRSFAPAHGIPEDPVCGSGNGCVAVWLREQGAAQAYLARQGRAIGRDGRISVRYDAGGIEIGGAATICIEGRIEA